MEGIKTLEKGQEEVIVWFEIVYINLIRDKISHQRQGRKNILDDFQTGQLIGLCYALQGVGVLSYDQLHALAQLFGRREF